MDFLNNDLVEDLRKKYNSKKWIYSKEELKTHIDEVTGCNYHIGENLLSENNFGSLLNISYKDFSEPEYSDTNDGFHFKHLKIGGDFKYLDYIFDFDTIPRENISIDIDEFAIDVNGRKNPISNLKGYRFDIGRSTTCNRYELEFLTINEEKLKFTNYCNCAQLLSWGPLERPPNDKFYPIWNRLLNAVEKFVAPHIFYHIMNELFERGTYSFGNKLINGELSDYSGLKVTVNGAFMIREILSIKREVLIPWEKIIFEHDRKNLRVSSKQVAINDKFLVLYKSEWVT